MWQTVRRTARPTVPQCCHSRRQTAGKGSSTSGRVSFSYNGTPVLFSLSAPPASAGLFAAVVTGGDEIISYMTPDSPECFIKFSIKLEITCPANKCVIQPELCAAACPVPFLTRSKLHPALLYLYNHFLSTLPRSCSTSLAYVSNAILVMIFFST